MTQDVVSVSVYWDATAWELARSAYVADLDDDPSGPDSFVWWLHQALDTHIARGPKARASLATEATESTEVTPPPRDGAPSFHRQHRLRTDTLEAIEAALTADRREANRLISRSRFLHEAVLLAAAAARLRRGVPLPPAPDQFPRGRPRGRTKQRSTS